MANPIIHSQSSVKKFGGVLDDYITIHEKMDCSKAYLSDNRHRALTHTMFWVKEVMIPIFGSYIKVQKDGKEINVSVKDICEQHILEDYRMKFIPTVQDFLQEMDFKEWMLNGKGVPSSAKKLYPELDKESKDIVIEPTTESGIDWKKALEDVKKQERVRDLTILRPVIITPIEPGLSGYQNKVLD